MEIPGGALVLPRDVEMVEVRTAGATVGAFVGVDARLL